MHPKYDSQVAYSNIERIISNATKGVETYVREGDIHFYAADFSNPQSDTLYCDRINGFIKGVVANYVGNKI